MSIDNYVNKASFGFEVLRFPFPVLVDFGAEWCAPCKRLEPILEQVAGMWPGQLRLVKVDVEKDPDLSVQFQVMSVPTVILFVGGKPVLKLTGLQTRQKLEEKINPWMAAYS